MKDRKHSNDKKNDDHVTSISTPLGHITIDSDLVDESFIDWTKDILTNDKKNKDNE